MKNRITELFSVKYPIIQAGMVWCSGWELASAVSNAGGLGIIGSGSMYPEILKSQIQKCQAATNQNFAVNVPLFYPDIDKHMEIIIKSKVPIVFTSAGNPNLWTKELKKNGIIVVHVISNLKFAIKAKNAGVDAIVAEGFEAGGHNGKEELTTFCLVPLIKKNVDLPLIAAGGIGSGKTMLSAMVLGAEGVQIGSRFVLSHESSAHINFKKAIINSKAGDTVLTLKELTPVRLLKNPFYDKIEDAYLKNKSIEHLRELLGRGRAKKGMFEGDMESGELEIGQISAYLNRILSAKEIIDEIMEEFKISIKYINEL
ncbi:MAG: nitronate monooxygenase [Flavobacteriales bacterium]|nr:nitronate monooxygenase [Flavobacteriales bacterium]